MNEQSSLFPLLTEAVKVEDLIERKDGLYYKKYARVPFTGVSVYENHVYEDMEFLTLVPEFYLKKYKNGQLHGPFEIVYKNGQLKTKRNFKNNKIQDGPVEYFFETGQLEMKTNFINGKFHGPYEIFNENGQLETKTNYKNGELHGSYELFSENGLLSFKQKYKEGNRHGLFKYYDEMGYLTRFEIWKNEELVYNSER